MSNILQAFTANGIAVVLLCSLMLNYRRNFHRDSREHLVFSLMVLTNMIQCIVEPVTIALDGIMFPGAVPLMTAMNALLYAGNITFALLWSVYADCKVFHSVEKRWFWLKCLPASLIFLGAVANLFFPVYFTVSDENIYTRTGLFLVPLAVTYFYLIMGTVTVYCSGWKGEKYVFLPALTFLAPVVIASVIQYLHPGISLLWVGAAIGLNSAYICVLDENSSVDTLSGAFNRHYLNQYLSALVKQGGQSRSVAGIMLDIDRFKSINDRFGHLVGDDAITNVGRLLRETVGSRGTVFRYAGDEFTVIVTYTDPQEITDLTDRIRDAARRFNETEQKAYEIHFSVGHSVFLPGESVNSFLKRIDDSMYQDKNNR